MGLYLVGAAVPDGTFTDKSSTYTSPSFQSTDFSFFLFTMHASSFPMDKPFSAWMTWDADTGGLLTSATCHVFLRMNPSGVLTEMTSCP